MRHVLAQVYALLRGMFPNAKIFLGYGQDATLPYYTYRHVSSAVREESSLSRDVGWMLDELVEINCFASTPEGCLADLRRVRRSLQTLNLPLAVGEIMRCDMEAEGLEEQEPRDNEGTKYFRAWGRYNVVYVTGQELSSSSSTASSASSSSTSSASSSSTSSSSSSSTSSSSSSTTSSSSSTQSSASSSSQTSASSASTASSASSASTASASSASSSLGFSSSTSSYSSASSSSSSSSGP